MSQIKRALISVSDKEGVTAFAKELVKSFGVEILSTGGTARALKEAGVDVRDVADYTGFPECLDGRVKTLHPKVHGGILGRRDLESHRDKMSELEIEEIDMVVVNLYPFEATIAKEGVTLEEAIENIDIGGPAMIRSAAKNHNDVVVIVDPSDYGQVIEEMKENGGAVSAESRARLAATAFGHTSWYDGRITSYLATQIKTGLEKPHRRFADRETFQLQSLQKMRYGENPHQRASFYKIMGADVGGFPDATQLHGKDLSFNNIVDMAASYELVCEFTEPACAIIKHTNPCGVARSEKLVDAYTTAREVDPVSAFGGVVAFNREVDGATANELSALFLEIIIAPSFSDEAMATLTQKKNLRLMTLPLLAPSQEREIKFVRGGALLQETDSLTLDEEKLKVVSKRQPTDAEVRAMRFAWTVAKHVKSNAIVYADENAAIGVGAGQMSRVDSSKIAISKANKPVKGSVMASDAFFPFRDSIDAAAAEGVTAIISPGGSVRDEEVIAAADEHGMAMLFTGVRHFKH